MAKDQNDQNLPLGRRLSGIVIETASEAIIVTDVDAKVVMVNPAFTAITGYAPEDVIGKNTSILASGHHDKEFYARMWSAINETGKWQGEIWNRRKSGAVFLEWLSIVAVKDEAEKIENYVAVFTDISQLRDVERTTDQNGNLDALTGLPNRVLLFDRLAHAITVAARAQTMIGVIYVDLDGFKEINDRMGHAAGDDALREVANRLRSCVRGADTVARIGGDEFVVLLPDIRQAHHAEPAARKIIDQLQQPITVGGEKVRISGSAGIAVYPQDGGDINALLSNSDLAMYRAKEEGKGTFRFFTQEMNASALERMVLAADLRAAMKQDQFELNYQPIMDVHTGTVVGVEALLRWQHPIQGTIMPGVFMPLAEGSGLMGDIGDWALGVACQQIQSWRDEGAAELGLFFNVSGHQFRNRDFAKAVAGALKKTGLPPDALTLEIAEDVIGDEINDCAKVLGGVREAGTRLAIDEFGSGASSLSSLKALPADIIKIGGVFTRDIAASAGGATLFSAIIALGHRLGCKIVAENVETPEQLLVLQSQACDYVQGYLFSRPLDLEATEAFLTEYSTS